MLDILNQLADTSSRKDKEAIIQGLPESHADMFKYVAWLAYDPSIDFYIKEFKLAEQHQSSVTLFEALQDLQNIIAKRTFTGNQAKQHIEMNHSMLSEDDAEVFRRVVKRNLYCGVSAKTVNKVWPRTIYEHPYMRCSGFTESNLKHISFPCFSQVKMDGLYCDVVVDETNDHVEFRTRAGNILPFNDADRDQLLLDNVGDHVLMGEALALDEDGSLMDRKSSNGYLNSNDVDPERVKFYLWDIVDIELYRQWHDPSDYIDRLTDLETRVQSLGSDFVVVDTVHCERKDDIIDHFKQMRHLGEEGTVIKDYTLPWKSHTSKKQIKVKVIFDCEVIVVGWRYSDEGKYEGLLGSIQCESSDGELQVSVGGGFSQKQRKELLDVIDQYVEDRQVITIRGNDVVTNLADPDKYSIFLPRFVEERFDKTEADSIEHIKHQVESFTNALDAIK